MLSAKGKAKLAKFLDSKKPKKIAKAAETDAVAKPAETDAAGKPAETDAAAAAPDALEHHHFLGKAVRVVDEEVLEIFGQRAEITKACEDGKFIVKSEQDPRSFKVREDQLDFLDMVAEKTPMKRLQINALEKEVLFRTFPDLCDHKHKEGVLLVPGHFF